MVAGRSKGGKRKFERTMKALFRIPKAEVIDEAKRRIYKPRKAKS